MTLDNTAYNDSEADKIVAEKNYGGDMVRSIVQGTADRSLPIEMVNATMGKRGRAEPVASLYGDPEIDWKDVQVRHAGTFSDLEKQMTSWVPDDDDSPDRLDVVVWALTELMIKTHSAQARLTILT